MLFCDIVDSTRIAGRLGAERWRERLDDLHAACDQVVRRHEGRVAQYLGDGVLVYFGHPRAHDDDAERSLRAALELQAATEVMRQAAEAVAEEPFAIRIGVHTGLSVVGEIGRGARREELALGDTLHLAARLQGVAGAGEVVCSAETLRLTRDRFRVEAIGSVRLKGFIDPVATYRVVEWIGSRAASTIAVSGAGRLCVGRERELSVLEAAISEAADARGQTITLTGEPGIGKTQLLQTLATRLEGTAHRWLATDCSPYQTSRALAPFIALLEEALPAAGGEPEVRRKELDELLAASGLEAGVAREALASLLGLPASASDDPSPALQRRRAMEALVNWVACSPAKGPTLLLVEDLHWADPSTLELLGLLMAAAPAARLLIVATWRPEFQAPWPTAPGRSALALSRLEAQDSARLARSIAGDEELSDGLVETIIARAEGVPLFVEEFTKSALEPGQAVDLPAGIPFTLQDTLAARLDRTEEGKDLAQLAAVIGREFSLNTLRVLAGLPEEALQDALSRLLDAELVFRTSSAAHDYRFKHALIRDAAYDSLLERTRRSVHERVGSLVADLSPPEVVAYHYSEARCDADAVTWWRRAAEHSMAQSATTEAKSQLERALRHVAALPEGAARDALEVHLLLSMTGVEQEQSGFASPRLAQMHDRAELLATSSGNPAVRLEAMMRKATYENTTARYEEAEATMRRLFELLETLPGLPPIPHFFNVLAIVLANRGRLEEGLALSERAREVAEAAPATLLMASFPEPWVTSESQTGLMLCIAGRPDDGLARSLVALERAESLDPPHPYSVGWARNYLSLVRYHRGEYAETRALAEANQKLGEERAFATWSLMGLLMNACAQIELGEAEAGIPLLEQGLGFYELSGARMIVPFFKGVLAEAKLRSGALDEAQALLRDAQELADAQGERYARPELDRIDAELMLARDPTNLEEAEVAFRRAIESASEAGQRLWGLRAASGLAARWNEQGRKEDVRQLIAPLLERIPQTDTSPPVVLARGLAGVS